MSSRIPQSQQQKPATFHAPFLRAARHELSKKAKETVLIYDELVENTIKQSGLSETLLSSSKAMSMQDPVLSRTKQNLVQIKKSMAELHSIVDSV